MLGPPPCLPSPGVADKESQWDTTASYACNLPGQLNMYVGLLSLSSEQSCYSPHLKSDCLNASGHGSPTSQQSSYPRLGDQPKHSPWVTSQLESCVSLCSNCYVPGWDCLPCLEIITHTTAAHKSSISVSGNHSWYVRPNAADLHIDCILTQSQAYILQERHLLLNFC